MEVRDVIDRINDEIVELISHFVELKPAGRNHKGNCPFHGEKTASFIVSPVKGIYKCFGCGKGGDAISFIMEHESADFREAVKIGAQKLSIDFQWQEQSNFNDKEHKHHEALHIVIQKAADYFAEQLTKNIVAKNYLKARGFQITDDDPFQIGYAPAGNTFLKWASEQKLNQKLLVEAGLIGYNKDRNQYFDWFRDRIMFPIANKTGKIIGFSGRYIGKDSKQAKYLNSPDTPIFNKGHELFALNVARHAIRSENRVYLVEGNFDVKRLHAIGVVNTIAPCGTAFTLEQARLLKRYTKNVTLIYDGDDAGRKAIDRNARLLVKEQLNVMVMVMPEGEDPDSLFISICKFEEFKDENQTDYIIFAVQNGEKRCQNPAYKSEFIKEIAHLITSYDDPSLHEVYMETVAQFIKPKKAWMDQVKIIVADKAPVEKKVYIPKTVSADEFMERGFYADNNCYYFANKDKAPVQRSNFVMSPLFHIESTINAKRLYEVKNVHNQVRVIEIPQRDLVSLQAFQVHIESLGNFWWDGSQADLNRLKRWLYEKTETCKEITQLGWQKEGFFAWGNGIFNGDFIPVDSYGIARHSNSSYYIPAFSSIYQKEANLFMFERKFIHMEGNVTLKEYAKKFVTVFGENAKIALSFYFAALFRDIVIRRFGVFPILNMFGPKGAGKTACAESLLHLFGRLVKSPNVHNTSKPALADHVASSVNALCHIDEYRNDIDMEKREFLKGMWDGTGRTRMNMDKDKKKETTSVEQAVVLTGQQMATADIALFSRFIFLCFTQTEFSDQEREDYTQLKEIEKRGLTHITHQILRLRSIFQDNFTNSVNLVNEKMRQNLGHAIVEDRIFNNWLVPLAAYHTLSSHIELPWDEEELVKLGVRLMLEQNKETKKNDDLGNFWKVVEYLISSNMLYEDGDYKVEFTNIFKRRYYEENQWKVDEVFFKEPKYLFFLTKSRVFSLYKSQCLREGDKPLPESTVEYYLKNSPAFICETKKESFQKIDPKTGMQESDDSGSKKRTSTTALVFDLAKLSISIGNLEQSEKQTEEVPENPQQNLDFNETPRTPPF